MVSPNWKTNYFSKWKSNFDQLWAERSAPPAETASPAAAGQPSGQPSSPVSGSGWTDPAGNWTWTGRPSTRTTWAEPERAPILTPNTPNLSLIHISEPTRPY